jgi:hypothetical protein
MAQKIKRVYKISVIVDRAKKEFAEGMGVGVLMTANVTFNCTQAEYDSPMFEMALRDKQRQLIDEVIRATAERVE